jgi:hypothetical protein
MAHYWRWKHHGDPLAGGTSPGAPAEYLKNVVLPYRGDDCLIWPYARVSGGYGEIRINDRPTYVHRIVCEDVNGSPPTPDHEAAHFCGNGHLGCVTGTHVRWATHAVNEADKLIHDTHNRGGRHFNVKLTEEQVREIRSLIGQVLQRDIADRFGIHPKYVSLIHCRRRWAWLA